MTHTRSALALAALVGMASCTDLKEYPVTGVTAGYFETMGTRLLRGRPAHMTGTVGPVSRTSPA